jgi:hypothetical protein
MPTSAADTEITYIGNGVTVAFPFPFEVSKASHFEATIDGAVVTAYTLSGLGVDTGGTCTFTDPPASLAVVVLARVAPYARTDFDYQEGGELAAATLDEDIDRAVMLSQQLATISDRSIRAPRGETMSELPAAASRANLLFGFDATGQPTALTSTASAAVSSAMAAVVAAASVDTARALLGGDVAGPSNIALSASASAGALTISLTGRDGAALSAGNPASVSIPKSSTDLWPISMPITSPQTLTVPSGALMGAVANIPFRLWIVAFRSAGPALTLGVINPLNAVGSGFPYDRNFDIYPLRAMGAADIADTLNTSSDAAATFYYSGAFTLTRYGYAVLGYVEYQTGLATPGTWVAPSAVITWAPGMPLPGEVVKTYGTRSTASATGATPLPVDDTIPQKTEGNNYLSASNATAAADVTGTLVNSSRCNILSARVTAQLASSNTDNAIAGALFLNADADAVAAGTASRPATANARCTLTLEYYGPNLDSGGARIGSVNFSAGTASAGTTTFNGSAGARTFGGRMGSQIICQEIMT